MKSNENYRVILSVILHLIRLGYEYVCLIDAAWFEDTNIITDIFKPSILKNKLLNL